MAFSCIQLANLNHEVLSVQPVSDSHPGDNSISWYILIGPHNLAPVNFRIVNSNRIPSRYSSKLPISIRFPNIKIIIMRTGRKRANIIHDLIDFRRSNTDRRPMIIANKRANLSCPINFEFQNYTIITSQCKGPRYPANLCCAALKEISCPFAEQLNDLTNDCASTMFSYINLYGKYPPGLFASECREGKEGLACGVAPAESAADTSRGLITHALSPFLVLTLGCV
ncbi:hypothetical protein GIB67_033316 [Kingdonia uniflora]|uniref:GPI-anchored protein LLG1-like domain-containing protein n=1 Tax=Kingdonia uniflora TaxID=39325 RepID=A0A7J7LTQ4_9MAGN|nr:hypothetical protein GIB67_033316 [Kingdonia uniflora]